MIFARLSENFEKVQEKQLVLVRKKSNHSEAWPIKKMGKNALLNQNLALVVMLKKA